MTRSQIVKTVDSANANRRFRDSRVISVLKKLNEHLIQKRFLRILQ